LSNSDAAVRRVTEQETKHHQGGEEENMAKLVFGLQQSLDGYVDHLELGPPGPATFRHFVEHVRDLAGIVYGRRMYEVMRYWDEDRADWVAEAHDFAAAWRSQPKWVVSRSLKSVGPNATLVGDDIEAVMRGLKAQLVGEIEVPDQTWHYGDTPQYETRPSFSFYGRRFRVMGT
jgi:hypothetical protein